MSMESQKQQSGQNNSSLQGDGITRRNLLVITGKSVACLTLAPLSHVLAETAGAKTTISKLFAEDAPIGIKSISSATSAIAWWTFDEGIGDIAYDSVGTDHGTIYGAQWATDKVGSALSALSFDGNNDYVLVGDKSDLEQQEFTLSFWAQADDPSASLNGGIAKGYIFGSSDQFSYKVDFHAGFARAGITNTSDTYFGITAPISDSNWHMWTMTVGGGTVTLYKDGSYQDSISYTGVIDYDKGNNNFVIGARSYGGYAFDGKMDDVHFYKQAFSDSEVLELYQNGVVKAHNPNPVNGAANVNSDVVLSWLAPSGAILHKVYLGMNETDVANGTGGTYKGSQSQTSYNPGVLKCETTYYWKINEYAGGSWHTGNIWSFTTGTFTGDIDGDGKVDENDLRIMVSEWLSSATSAISNLDDSYTYIPGTGSAASAIVSVDFNDFSILAGDWQKECSACSAVASVDFNKRVQRRLASSARRRFGQIARRRIEST